MGATGWALGSNPGFEGSIPSTRAGAAITGA